MLGCIKFQSKLPLECKPAAAQPDSIAGWQLRNAVEDELGVARSPMCTAKFDYLPLAHPAQDPQLFRAVQHGCAALPAGCAKF